MKKTYSKPQIVFESFRMSSNIANTCGNPMGNSSDENTCEVIEQGYTIFTASNTDCVGNHNCYHVPQNDPTIFGS